VAEISVHIVVLIITQTSLDLIKGLVHPKMKIMPVNTQPHVVLTYG